MAIVEIVPPSGAYVRTVLLSGSRAKVRSLYVDADVNAETVQTSYSASIGENLHVAGNVFVQGYQVVSGSQATVRDWPNVGLEVSESAVIEKDLHVVKDASISGSLAVKGSSSFGDVEVNNLKVNGSASIAQNLTVTGSAVVKNNVTVQKNLTVSKTGSIQELNVPGSASIGKQLVVGGSEIVQENLTVAGDLNVQGTATYINTEDLYVKDKVIEIASGSQTGAQANGAGLLIDGAGIFVTWSVGDNKWHTNAGIDIEGPSDFTNINVSQTASVGHLEVSNSANFGGNVGVGGNLNVTQNITATSGAFQDIKSNGIISGAYIYGDGSNLINCKTKIETCSVHREELDIVAGATQSVVHPFHTADVVVNVYKWDSVENSSATQVYPGITIRDDDTVEISSSEDLKGYVVIANAGHLISGSISLLEVATDRANIYDVDGTSIYRFQHKLGSENIIVSAYEYELNANNGKASQIIPEKITIVDPNHVDIIFGRSLPDGGYVVFAKAGHIVKNANLVESVTVSHSLDIPAGRYEDFYHGFGTENVLVQVYKQEDGQTFLYNEAEIEILDAENIRIHVPQSEELLHGYVVIGKAGHIVSGTVDIWANNIHYGTNGDWEANSFTAHQLVGDTCSAAIVTATEYVDTPRVGNLNTNEGYVGQAWGSYTEYSDYFIEEFIKPSEQEDPQKVSSIDHNGNLSIKGDLTPNAVFASSDIKLKENLRPVENALGALDQIRGYRYTMKDTRKESIGVVAQDVQRVYPELVKTVPGMTEQKEHLTVNYNGLVAVLWEAVRQLSARVEELENKR